MNRDKRQFVHELSDHFGIESESYDAEPKRNVVATGNWFYSFFFSIFTYLLGFVLTKFLLLLLQLSKIESGCLLNQFLMWFKDYEKLQHLLLSTQTLNRKSACFFYFWGFFFFRNLVFLMRKFDIIFICFFLYLGLLQLYNLLQCWNFPQQIQTMIHQVNQLLSTTLTLMAEK